MRFLVFAVAVAGLAMTSGPSDAESSSFAAGGAVAQRNCATCHAIADGESPLEDAPPFARLSLRYGAGGLAELLEKGMIKNYPRPLEEGTRLLHPRMPAFPLDEDEVVALADYIRTFEKDERGPKPSAKPK